MKIAYISYLPIADVDFSYLHEAQRIMDITCFLFVNQHHINRSVINFHTLLEKTGIYQATEVSELQCYNGYLNLEKIRVVNIAFSRTWQYDSLKLFCQLTKQLEKEYDIVHLTRLPQWFEVSFFKLRHKVVLSVHDPIPHSGHNWKNKLLTNCVRRITFSLFNNFIIFNEAQKKLFVDRYKLKKKNIISSKLSCYTCLQSIKPDEKNVPLEKYILFTGRITKYKGLQYLLPAFRRVHEVYPELRLVVAGNGTFCFDVEDYERCDYIEFRNRFIPDKELIALIKHCIFLVCPYTDATQSGVIMSAFAFGVPVLATDVGGLPEMVRDGVFGKIIREKDENAIVSGICDMLNDAQKIKLYSDNINHEYSEGEMSWKEIAAKLKKDYQTCI